MRSTMVGLGLAAAMAVLAAAQQPKTGVVLGEMSWQEAETALTPASVVVLPLGGAAVEHGPHLKLDHNDRLARYLAQRVRAAADVVIAPSLAYHFYPSFVEYPGSTSLSQNTARDMTVDVVRSLAKHGPRRFYVLNTGIATMTPLKAAADALANDGILLGYTDMRYRLLNARVSRQQAPPRGPGHADEIETSMMLFVDPAAVDMRKAAREYGAGTGALTRVKDGPGMYSESGVVGDATVATREKGQAFVDAVIAGALEDIESIRTARLPTAKTSAPVIAPPPPPRPAASMTADSRQENGCFAADERAIRAVGERFSYLWRQLDALEISRLFAVDGDMRHPDGTIEKGREVIRANRAELFAKREYRGSNHPVTLYDIRCLAPTVALADGKWEMRLDENATTGAPARNLGPGKRHSGLCTLVLTGGSGSWSITAWRYTVDPTDGTPPPTTLKQPGFFGRGRGGG